MKKQLRVVLCVCFFMLITEHVAAQEPVKVYTIKNGKIYIALSKKLPGIEIDSFALQFGLENLKLHLFIQNNFIDSLKSDGWKIELNNKELVIISRYLEGSSDVNNPSDHMFLGGMAPPGQAVFSAVNNGERFGYNRFKNKHVFYRQDSIVTFFLRGYPNAKNVRLAGSFTNWESDALTTIKTDSGWIAYVPLSPGKYWYKFIIDGNWITDPDNDRNENDGFGNDNSVYYCTNHVFTLDGFADAKRAYVTGSFNDWKEPGIGMNKTATGWELPIYLAEGTHTYKFVVNKQWYQDMRNPDKLPDGATAGGFNSVVAFGKPYLFKLDGYKDAKKVIVVGSFNNWREFELEMKRKGDGWELPYVIGPGNYEYKFVVDGKWVPDPNNPGIMTPGNKQPNSYMVIGANYTFRLKAREATTVFVAGDFNGWSPNAFPMHREGDEWVFGVHLSIGKHLYKFLVDGKWIKDPANKLWEQNEYDTGNSVLWIDR